MADKNDKSHSSLTSALMSSLGKANLVPGPAEALIPSTFQPSIELCVSFSGKPVTLGNFFKAGECKEVPMVSFGSDGAVVEGKTYLFMMIDPDAPTPADPKFAFWRHFVVSRLRLADDAGAEAVVQTMGPAVTAYLAPGPKEDSGPHRYLFLLFEEPRGLKLTKEDVGGEEFVQRRSFKAAEFVAAHGFKLVGVNWMSCAWDGYDGE